MVDDEFNKFAIAQTKTFATLTFGRVTYQLFKYYWPKAAKDPKTSNDDLENVIRDLSKNKALFLF